MSRTSSTKRIWPLLASACWLGLSYQVNAQTIANPSFEADSYANFPGYASGNGGVITGWTIGNANAVGLNPSGGSPFADNGTIPAGSNVAFLQNSPTSTLGTTITGLTNATAYRVSFRANARAENSPNLKVTLDAASVAVSVDFAAPVVDPVLNSVNSANPYHYVSFTFTATGTTAALSLLNDAGGDNTLVVDNFSIDLATAPLPAAIVATRWTGDANSGIDSQYRYTHAHTFGGNSITATVNSVLFTPATGGNPAAANHFTTAGLPNAFGAQSRTISGGSNQLAQSFIYGNGGETRNITVSGLRPNTTYVTTVYGVGWENGQRSADFSGSYGAGPNNVNLDSYGVTNGITVRYRYTTDASATPMVLTYSLAAGSGTFHTAGFSNREALPGSSPNTWSIAPWSNDATSGVNDGAVYEYTHAYNFGSANNAVINGVTFVGKPGPNPSGTNFSVDRDNGVFANDPNNVTDAGGSRTLANDFIYNGFPASYTLTGLTAGTEYQLTLFSVGWDPSGRTIQFQGYSQNGASSIFDQDTYGDNNGIRVNYVYTAPASGSITVTANPTAAGSFHVYGLANRKTAPQTVLAFISQPQHVYLTAAGGTATFSASASGQLPLTYQWRKNGVAIPGQSGTTNLTTSLVLTGVTAADVADYTVAITGSGQGTIVSSPAAHLYLLTDKVPGLFDTGMGDNCVVLPDGAADPHYLIITNPDGDSLIPAVVEDSSTFPLNWAPPATGPWVQNSALSKWVGPRFNTASSAGEAVNAGAGNGVYVYSTTFDLTGFDLSTVRISGGWATDNLGVKILVNGIDVGLTNTAQFPTLTPFLITGASNFVPTINTLDFYVQNQTVALGYTGLRVEGIQGFGNILPNTPPHIATNPVNTTIAPLASSCLSVSASGSAPLSYQWYKGGVLIPGAINSTLPLTATTPAVAGNYTVVVSNGVAPAATSAIAIVNVTNFSPTYSGYAFGTTMNAVTTIGKAKLLTGGADIDGGTLALDGVSVASAQGGTVAVSGSNVVYSPPTNFTGLDTFTVNISDGQGGTGSGTVTVNVGAGTGISYNQATITPQPGGSMAVLFMGIPGQSYQIQRSTDLLNWSTLTTATAAPDGTLPYTDASPPVGSAFYRTKVP